MSFGPPLGALITAQFWKNNNKGKDRLNIAEKYVKFLKERTKIKSDKDRKKLIFKSK